METYRIINRELSINNQELRNVVNKLKCEVTLLNRMLFDQREEFARLKASIASTIEQKYIETMAFIFPERNSVQNASSQSKLNIRSHRRSCSNATAADPLQRRSCSPPASSPASNSNELVVDASLKMSVPKIVIERDTRISKSPGKCPQSVANQNESRSSTDLQNSKNCIEKNNNFVDSESEQTLQNSNITLHTINEEQSDSIDPQNETLSDNTIYCLLDAPCSTPNNPGKLINQTMVEHKHKKVRVLIKRLQMDNLLKLSTSQAESNYCSQPIESYNSLSISELFDATESNSIHTFNKKPFKSKKAMIESYSSQINSQLMNASECNTINSLKNTSFKSKKAMIESYNSQINSELFDASESNTIDTFNKNPEMIESYSSQIDSQLMNASECNTINTLNNTSFKSKKALIEDSNCENNCFQFNTINDTTCKYNRDISLNKESLYKPVLNKIKKKESEDKPTVKVKKTQKPVKKKQNKENNDTDSEDSSGSDEDYIPWRSRNLRKKKISMKEPNLRKKLRNTTNLTLR